MPVKRTAFGITYYSLSLHDVRAPRSLFDLPREWWAILRRPPTNYELRNRIDHRDGAWPQSGAVDHIGAGFEDRIGLDTGAELLCEYGLNPGNTRASWNVGGDSDSVCLLAPGDTRPWQHGVTGSPYDLNSYGIGYEDGILSSDWRKLPADKATAHLRMRAAWWALVVGTLGWPLKYTDTPAGVWDHIRRGQSWGFTQHGIVDPANRSDAGLVREGGRRINTFDYDRLFRMIREEMQIRTGGGGTPGLPAPSDAIKALQLALNEWGHNLDVDGSYGDLTTTAARETATDTDYTGDLTDVAALTTHLEDTMSKITDLIDGLPAKTADVVWRQPIGKEGAQARSWLRGGNLKAGRGAVAAQDLVAQVAGLQAAVVALATGSGDPAAIEKAAYDGAARALAGLTVTVAVEPEDAA